MNTVAIDIGGTKFSIAMFDGDRVVRRESRATDREDVRDRKRDTTIMKNGNGTASPAEIRAAS